MQVLIPMSGQGDRFRDAGYSDPKPLITINQVPMITRLLEKLPLDWPCIFVLAENHLDTELPALLKKLRPTGKILSVKKNKEGPALAIEAALPHLLDEPVLISYCDYGLKWDPWDFAQFVKNTDCDACLLSYRGFHSHYLSPVMYAYSKTNNELVKEIKEKGSFTDNRENEYASAGAYYFKGSDALKTALAAQRSLGLKVNGELYTSLTVQALLQKLPNAQVRIYEIDAFFQWGTPQDLKDFEYWENTFNHWNKHLSQITQASCSQVLMPMAGQGSRLSHLFASPKPLICIGETPMYRRALNSFPQPQQTIYVTLKEIAEKISLQENEKLVSLQASPAGQALSTELGLPHLAANQDFIVTACDHSVVLAPEVWNNFIAAPNCDAAIFTVRGFPGAHRNPQSYSYVKAGTGVFPIIQSVSLKKPFSNKPQEEALLVGSFWFKNSQVAQKGIEELKQKGERLNGELYLDAVFNLLIDRGLIVREIPLQGYVNWGDPECLKESIYWFEIFMGHRLESRNAFSGAQ